MNDSNRIKQAGIGIVLLLVVLGSINDVYTLFVQESAETVEYVRVGEFSDSNVSDEELLGEVLAQKEERIMQRLIELDRDNLSIDEVEELERLFNEAKAISMFDSETLLLIEQDIAQKRNQLN